MDEVGIMSVVMVIAVVTDNILGPRTPTKRMGEIMNKPNIQNMLVTNVEAKAIGVAPVILQNI